MKPWVRLAVKAAVMAIVAAALAAIGRLDDSGGGNAGTGAAGDLTFDPASVQAVSLARIEEPPVRIERVAGDAWRITAPFDAPADAREVTELLARFAAARSELLRPTNGAPAPQPSRYGLTPPRLVITAVNGSGDVLRRLSFGGRNPYDGSVYVAEEGVPVARVSAPVLAALDGPAESFRIRTVLPFELATVRSIVVTVSEAPPLRLSRSGDGWVFQPDLAPADSALVRAWLAAMAGARLRRYVDHRIPEEATSLGSSIVIRFGADVALSTSLRWSSTSIALRVAPGEPSTLVELPAQLLEGLMRTRKELADRRVLSFVRSDVGRIKVALGSDFVVIVRGARDHWELRAPSTRPIAPGLAGSMLRGLAELRYSPGEGKGVDDTPAPPAGDGADAALPYVIELYEPDGLRSTRIELTPRPGGFHIAKVGDVAGRVPDGEVASLDLETIMSLGL